jgi:hypothetical protein
MQRVLMRAMSNARCWMFHRGTNNEDWLRPEMVCMDANYGQGICGKINIILLVSVILIIFIISWR